MEWQPPDSFHLSAAQGWLELGNWREAKADLQRLAPHLQKHPDALRLQVELLAQAKRWEESAEVAAILAKLIPEDPFPHLRRAFALHELRRTQEAHDLLAPVAGRFPDEWVIPYNLACYCAQLGQIDASMDWLIVAADRNRAAVRDAAADDPDLLPLHSLPKWAELQRTLRR